MATRTPSTEVAQRTPTQEALAQLRHPSFIEQIKNALPGNVTPERFVRVAMTAIQQTPELVTVDRASLFGAIVRCAQDGLLPDGREAALVVFGGKAQYMSMIFGLRKIAANHGFSLEAHVVYEHDTFEWELGFEPTVTHRPPRLDQPRGEPVGAYSVATDRRTGQKFLEVMSRQEIEAVRAMSKAANGPAWTKSWGEMSRKTVGRRNFKQLPLGDLDEREDSIVRQADVDVDLPDGQRMTVDEADIAVSLKAGPPADDDRPHDVKNGTAPATPAQHATLLALIVDLSTVDPDIDHQAAAAEYADVNFGKALTELTATEADELLDKMRERLANGQAS